MPNALLEIGNSGVTPAYDVTTLAACLVYPFPLPDNTPFPPMNNISGPQTTTKTVIHPSTGAINTNATCDMDWPNGIDPENLSAIMERTSVSLYVFCLATYKDAFGEARETRFCAAVDLKTDLPKGRVRFEHTDQHNTAT